MVRWSRDMEMEALREERLKELKEKQHPRSEAQFSKLFMDLDEWRRSEVLRIKELYPPGEERKQAMAELLTRETKALQDIQRLKSLANKDHAADKTRNFLELLAEPLQWQLSNGLSVPVETPQTLKAASLLNTYLALCEPVTVVPARLEVLRRVREAVELHQQAPLVRDILELVAREEDLHDRNRSIRSMEHLRIRLGNLFLQFIEDGKYNTRAVEFVKY